MVDEQLRAAFEELRQRFRPVVGVKPVLLLDPHPWQLTPLLRELVAEPGVLLLAPKQLLASRLPLLRLPTLCSVIALASLGCIQPK